MDLIIQKLINSVMQLILFSLLPFICWFFTSRKKTGFFEWIGLKRVRNASEKLFFWMVATTLAYLFVGIFVLISLKGVETATSEFWGLGLKALPAILVYAIFNTSLPEEILFRGFILKQTANKVGFQIANFFQALLFGLAHGVLLFPAVGVLKATIIIIFTGAIGWMMGYINEKKADGSLLPSLSIHVTLNIISGLLYAFMLF